MSPLLRSDEISILDIPVETIEHILSFCKPADLRTLTITCSEFRNVVNTSVKLISKLRFVIDFKKCKDEKDFEKIFKDATSCLEIRKFTAWKLYDESWEYFRKSQSDREGKLSRHILLRATIFKLLGSFPSLKSCCLVGIEPWGQMLCLEPLPRSKPELDSLIELDMFNTSPAFLMLFYACKNLKVLRLDEDGGSAFSNVDISKPFPTVKFKLEKLHVNYSICPDEGETFLYFLINQSHLQEVSLFFCFEFENSLGILDAVMAHPKIERINLKSENAYCRLCIDDCPKIAMSNVLYEFLGKFKIWSEFKPCGFDMFHWVYAPESPRDMNAFEHHVIAFLDSDCDIPGRKHSEIIDAITIGQQSWLDVGSALSNNFISSMITKVTKLTYLKLYSASSLIEINETIAGTGKNFTKLKIFANDGSFVLEPFSSNDSLSLQVCN